MRVFAGLVDDVLERRSARMAFLFVAGRPPRLAPRSGLLQGEAGSLKEVLGESAGADFDLVGQR